MDRVIVYDLETQKTFDEVGGQRNAAALGISILGAYDFTEDKYYALREKDLGIFLELLKETKLLIGFNSIKFDNKVLQPYYSNFDVDSVPHLDLLEEITNSIGHRVKLDSIANSTLHEGKTGDGLDAVRYFRANAWQELTKYCLDDVRITKDVYEYGLRHGYLWYHKAGKGEKIPISYAQDLTIPQLIEKAVESHRQLEIVYIIVQEDKEPVRVQMNVDPIRIEGDRLRCFTPKTEQQHILHIARILTAKIAGDMSVYQQNLI